MSRKNPDEFQTQNWPCESCVEVLKNIKNFWQIIADRIFNVKFNKYDDDSSVGRSGSFKYVINRWEREMSHQTGIIKVIASKQKNINNHDISTHHSSRSCSSRESEKFEVLCQSGDAKSNRSNKSEVCIEKVRCDRTTSVTVAAAVDASCSSSNMDKEHELQMCKINMNLLEEQFNQTQYELEQLKNENDLLREELESAKQENKIEILEGNDDFVSNSMELSTEYEEPSVDHDTREVESQIFINLKDAKDENFEHISLLQIVHKSNRPQPQLTINENELDVMNENPIQLLTKVQDKLGVMLSKEIEIAQDQKTNPQSYDLESSFQTMYSDGSSN